MDLILPPYPRPRTKWMRTARRSSGRWDMSWMDRAPACQSDFGTPKVSGSPSNHCQWVKRATSCLQLHRSTSLQNPDQNLRVRCTWKWDGIVSCWNIINELTNTTTIHWLQLNFQKAQTKKRDKQTDTIWQGTFKLVCFKYPNIPIPLTNNSSSSNIYNTKLALFQICHSQKQQHSCWRHL
jgi:hypothetical protein